MLIVKFYNKRIRQFALGLGFCHPKPDSAPTFTWVGEPAPDQPPCLKITFPDGGEDDVAHLRQFNPIPLAPHERSEDLDSCIFHGYLEFEKDVYITVTGCPESDKFLVTVK